MIPMKPEHVLFDAAFEKKFEKYKKRLTEKERANLRGKFEIFKENVFDKRLKTHKLKGGLEDYYAFSLSYENRLVFKIADNETVYLVEIGSHDVCY